MLSPKRRTWKESKDMKKAVARDREFYDTKKDGKHNRPPPRPGGDFKRKKKLSIEQLKLVTKCGRCGEVGHWHKECKNDAKPNMSGRVFIDSRQLHSQIIQVET